MASQNNPSQQRSGQGGQKQPEIDPQTTTPGKTPVPQADPQRRQAQPRDEGNQSQRQQRSPGENDTPERSGGEEDLTEDEAEQGRTASPRQDSEPGSSGGAKQNRNPGSQSHSED